MFNYKFIQLIKDIWFSFFILIICIGFVIISKDYGRDASLFPFTVGILTSTLLCLEIFLKILKKENYNNESLGIKNTHIFSVVWFILTIITFLYIGIVFAIFISSFFYWRLFIKTNIIYSILIGFIHSFLFWFGFEFLAGFRLYSGILDL